MWAAESRSFLPCVCVCVYMGVTLYTNYTRWQGSSVEMRRMPTLCRHVGRNRSWQTSKHTNRKRAARSGRPVQKEGRRRKKGNACTGFNGLLLQLLAYKKKRALQSKHEGGKGRIQRRKWKGRRNKGNGVWKTYTSGVLHLKAKCRVNRKCTTKRERKKGK